MSHKAYLDVAQDRLSAMVKDGGIIVDVKSVLDPARLGRGIRYWSL